MLQIFGRFRRTVISDY